jgi:hypothetical protein
VPADDGNAPSSSNSDKSDKSRTAPEKQAVKPKLAWEP